MLQKEKERVRWWGGLQPGKRRCIGDFISIKGDKGVAITSERTGVVYLGSVA